MDNYDEILIQDILRFLNEGEDPFYTTKEIRREIDMSPQKASSIMRRLEESGYIKSKVVQTRKDNYIKCYYLI